MSIDVRTYRRLVAILRDRESELFTIRHSFDELSEKFSQLENAFAINLRVHNALERELEMQRLEKNSNETNPNYVVENAEKTSVVPMEVYMSLTGIRIEKERWKEAFLHEKKITERLKREHEKTMNTIREECVRAMINCRETGEKQLRELSKIYEDSLRKARESEEALISSKAKESLVEERLLELANLLETLARVKGVKIDALCIHAAEVLRSLEKCDANPYAESMKKLRHITWDTKEDNESRGLEFLQAQNSVLRQIVKRLKRKDNLRESPRDDECAKQVETNNNPNVLSVIEKIESEKSCDKSMKSETKNIIGDGFVSREDGKNFGHENPDSFIGDETKIETENTNIRGNAGPRSKKSICIEAFESHVNGTRCDEYTFNFSNDREMRVRHVTDYGRKNSTLNVEFVNSERKFYDAPVDRTVIYLGENVQEITNFDKNVMHCSTQTRRPKFCEKFVQTAITGSNGFFRANVRVGIMNSEKRAIERSVGNLESTVASLKENALDEARSMIGCDVKYLGDEFFKCVQYLES